MKLTIPRSQLKRTRNNPVTWKSHPLSNYRVEMTVNSHGFTVEFITNTDEQIGEEWDKDKDWGPNINKKSHDIELPDVCEVATQRFYGPRDIGVSMASSVSEETSATLETVTINQALHRAHHMDLASAPRLARRDRHHIGSRKVHGINRHPHYKDFGTSFTEAGDDTLGNEFEDSFAYQGTVDPRRIFNEPPDDSGRPGTVTPVAAIYDPQLEHSNSRQHLFVTLRYGPPAHDEATRKIGT